MSEQAPKPPELFYETDAARLKDISQAIALSYGYRTEFEVSDQINTFATTFNRETQAARVIISRELMQQAEVAEGISPEDFFGITIGHELGHVEHFRQEAEVARKSGIQFGVPDSRTAYFKNMIEDLAIDTGMMARASYYNDLYPVVYDQVLFPQEGREKVQDKPKHIQLMTSILVLPILDARAATDGYTREDLEQGLKAIHMSVAPEVEDALAEIIAYKSGDSEFNLLRILRTHGKDYQQRTLASNLIRKYFDKLYEEDAQDQSEDSDDFDYSDAGGCKHKDHGHQQPEQPAEDSPQPQDQEESEDSDESQSDASADKEDADGDENQAGDEIEDGQTEDEGDGDGDESSTDGDIDTKELYEAIAESIIQETDDEKEAQEQEQREAKEREERAQKEALRKELELPEDDFEQYLEARNRYDDEIEAFADLVSRLKRERNDTLLSPGNDLRARGHRINVKSLVRAVANDTMGNKPDIFKAPKLGEKIEYEFNGLDLFLLCDISGTMQGMKAREAAASAVIILEGLMRSSEVASVEDLVRVQIQAFGNQNYTLAPLSPRPEPTALGKTYSKILHPKESTYVAGSLKETLEHIQPVMPGKTPRLQIVGVVSDGDFYDKAAAQNIGRDIHENGGLILQFVYGGAQVTKLHEDAKVIDVKNAKDLPEKLFELLPELLEYTRRSHVQ